MTLEQARDAYIDAVNRTLKAHQDYKEAQAAEEKAREVYRKLFNEQIESN